MLAEKRSLEDVILTDLKKKFVFLSGPRQVGKTTLAKKVIKTLKGHYLLYDDVEDRRTILEKKYTSLSCVCLDEFHKYARWKNHIKGVFDKYHDTLSLLLTGSARLDVFQKSGDSLFGRYYLHHLHPLTLGELHGQPSTLPANLFEPHEEQDHLEELLKFGGFPEPFFSQSETEHRRWSNHRRQLLIREDFRELTHIQLLSLVEQLMLTLPRRIGSLFSLRSIAEDLGVAPPTVAQWMEVFKKLFLVFSIPPYSKKVTRSLKKQPKYYFYDWSQIEDEGARFENLIASHLWKSAQTWTDRGLANVDLYFVRDRDQREADFLLTREGKPWFLVECKLSETQISDNLRFFSQRLGVPGLQIIQKENTYRREGGLTVISAHRWLGHLG